jgi:ectoine hydroxylase-related dioxygenase (phytanoyl-CoA dioxygenase family)
MTLTQQQIDEFHKNGYLKYGKILEDEEIELLREQYDLEFERARKNNSYRNLSIHDGSDVAIREVAPKRMLQVMEMSERNIHFRRLVYKEEILDIVEDLIGSNIQLFHDQALYKPANDGGAVAWHQDNGYWKCRPANLVSCWLTLDDVDISNGAMQVIPGSHLTPVWHEQSKQTNALLEFRDLDESNAVAVDLPAGGCMLHHCQTLHHTAANTTDRQRRAFAIHCMPPGTRLTSEHQEDKGMAIGFQRPLLRARM